MQVGFRAEDGLGADLTDLRGGYPKERRTGSPSLVFLLLLRIIHHLGGCQNYGPFLGPYYNTLLCFHTYVVLHSHY